MKKEVLRLDNIYLSSTPLVSLQNITFHLFQGELLGLFGILDSGVKQMVHILREQLPITSGVIYRNEALVKNPLSDLQPCLNIGYVGQAVTLITGLAVRENLIISKRAKGNLGLLPDESSLNAEIAVLLADLGIDDLIDPSIKSAGLSVFERHLVEIAKLVYADKDIIVLDEIGYSYLEEDFRRLHCLIKRLNTRNISVIYVSNTIDYMAEYLNRIIVLRNGRNAGTMYAESFDPKKLLRMLLGSRQTSSFSPPTLEAGKPVIQFLHYTRPAALPVHITVSEGESVGLFSFEHSIPEELSKLIVDVNLKRKETGCMHYTLEHIWEITLYNTKEELVVIPQNAIARATYPEKSILENYLLLIYQSTSKMGLINHGFLRYMENVLDEWYGKEPGWARKTRLRDTDEIIQKKLVFHKWLFHKACFAYIEFPDIYADPLLKEAIFALIHDMAKRRLGILICSNNIYELLSLCSKIVILSKNGTSVILTKEEALSIDLFDLLVGMK